MTLKQTRFELRLLICYVLLFQVFNATDDLKGTKATQWFLDLKDIFTEVKSLFWHILRKYFAINFAFDRSLGINSAR